MSVPAVLVDANILFSPPLRDLIIELSNAHFFRARWTQDIHLEWIRAVRKQRPDLPETVLNEMRELINQAVADCVITGYETLIDALELPDPDDRHVLAAAIKGDCSVILTRNVRDFPRKKLRPYSVRALTPTEFLKGYIEIDRKGFVACLRDILHRHPGLSVGDYAKALRQNRLKAVANILLELH